MKAFELRGFGLDQLVPTERPTPQPGAGEVLVKLRALSRWIVGVPLLVVMVVFALSNTEPVRFELFPLGRLPFDVPLSVAILAALGLGFLLGGIRVRIAELRHRRTARRAQEELRLLEAKHQELKSRSTTMVTSRGCPHG